MASGQCEPHKQAEHMAAPTSMRREVFSCQLGAVHTWHFSTVMNAGYLIPFEREADITAWLRQRRE
jgi:hypothetical protein